MSDEEGFDLPVCKNGTEGVGRSAAGADDINSLVARSLGFMSRGRGGSPIRLPGCKPGCLDVRPPKPTGRFVDWEHIKRG